MSNEEDLRKKLTEVFQKYIEYQDDFNNNKLNFLNMIEYQNKIEKDKQIYLSSILNSVSNAYNKTDLSMSILKKVEELQLEIKEKETHNKQLLTEIERLKSEKQDITDQLTEIRKNNYYIQKRETLLRLTSSVHPKAANIFLGEGNSELLDKFHSENESQNVILAIDIRRSTDLMLNANSSEDFASFITGLCEGLKQIVIANFGVFDKFTGDGILAYFPLFYSGGDAVERSCITAQLCHDFYSVYYKEKRNKFKINLKTGLGIGIDYGAAKLVRINEQPTIVGVPVVYACRLSNAPSGHTYLNQPAFQLIKDKNMKINEIEVDIKSQGTVMVYDLIDLDIIKLREPDWFFESQDIN